MSKIKKLGTGTGYLKAGFLGFPKSGKSYTAGVLACGVKKHFSLEGPIVMFDTEGGSDYIAPLVKKLGGGELVGIRSRAFDDRMAVGKEALEMKAAVLIVDSVTHPWRELCDAHLEAVNRVLKSKNRSPRTRLEFQDWASMPPPPPNSDLNLSIIEYTLMTYKCSNIENFSFVRLLFF